MAPGKRITIAEIQTSDILFYDPDLRDQCFKFCADRNIDCLPALNDPKKIFLRDEEARGFREELVNDDRIINGEFNIFEPEILDRFRKQPLLMVFHSNDLTGVVHFADYNLLKVSQYLYEMLFVYEKSLRGVLALQQHKPLKSYEKLGLKETIELANEKCGFNFDVDVKNLRNDVMHAKEFVNRQDPTTNDLIYDIKTFEKFFNRALALLRDCRATTNRLAFISER